MSAPRSINSGNPFVSTALKYVENGWGVLPLPEKRKEFPPTGFTGRAGKIADKADLDHWLSDPKFAKGNIALRLGKTLEISGRLYEIIGIDVDDYKGKHGGAELKALEERFGPLPDTWTSSARTDGVSGIRYFMVPHGYGYKGSADESIEIIQRVHRYAVVYPSWHPDTQTQYFWYAPGTPPGKNVADALPNAYSLPLLPDKWLDYLTLNRTADIDFGDGRYGIDLDATAEELNAWIAANFFEPNELCPHMRKVVAGWNERVAKSATNHDLLKNGHWNIVRTASEGHGGYETALNEFEAVWFEDIMSKGKRPSHVVAKEMARSRDGAFRKLKAKADSFAEQKLSLFAGSELCMTAAEYQDMSNTAGIGNIAHDGHLGHIANSGSGEESSDPSVPQWIYTVPLTFEGFDPKDYEKNDVGQAQHFYDRVGDNVRYLSDFNGWVIYDGLRWHLDDFSHVRNLFHRAVVVPSKKRARKLWEKASDDLRGGRYEKTDPMYLEKVRDAKKLDWVAEHYGNDAKIRGALTCMKSIPGVAMRYSDLNWDGCVLAMPNGKILRLDEPGVKPNRAGVGFAIEENRKSYLTTYCTAVEFVEAGAISKHERLLWKAYLDLFLPDQEYRRFVQKALGYMLIGGNPEKLAIFLVGQSNTGKSTMLQAIQGVMGDYGGTFQPNAIFKDSSTGNNPELGNLLHKRGIFSSESGSQRIHANPLKRNTGGDEISITRKYANDQIVGVPQFLPIVATNQAPTINDADEALVKRILVLPFTTSVPPGKNDKRADVELRHSARHAVLNWLVHGYRRYIREGLNQEDWHSWAKAATMEFASELSDVAAFLAETCIAANADVKSYLMDGLAGGVISERYTATKREWSKVSVSGLYMKFQHECAESGQTPMPPRLFAKKVRQIFGVSVTPVWVDGKVAKHYFGLKYLGSSEMNQVQG